MTQIKLARATRMSQTRYWQIENGETAPTDAEKAAIAAALGVTVKEIAWPVVESRVPA